MKKIILAVLALGASLFAVESRATDLQQQLAALPDQTAMSQTILGQGTAVNTNVTTSTGSPVWNLTYTGSAVDAEVEISTAATGSASLIQFQAPAGTVDTTIGSTSYGKIAGANAAGGTFDLSVSTMQQMGTLCDAINNSNGGGSSSNWHCTLIGAIRTDIASTILPIQASPAASVNNAGVAGGWNAAIGTNTIVSLGIIPSPGRRVVLQQCSMNAAGNSTNPPSWFVYGVPRKWSAVGGGRDPYGAQLTDSYQAHQYLLTSATVTTLPTLLTATPSLEFAANPGGFGAVGNVKLGPVGANQYNGHVVIRMGAYATGNGTQTSANYLSCSWYER